jgi:hypothetical protein
VELNEHCEAYRRLYNEVRPHEMLGQRPPLGAYLAAAITFDEERRFVEGLRGQETRAGSGGQPDDGTQPISRKRVQEG